MTAEKGYAAMVPPQTHNPVSFLVELVLLLGSSYNDYLLLAIFGRTKATVA